MQLLNTCLPFPDGALYGFWTDGSVIRADAEISREAFETADAIQLAKQADIGVVLCEEGNTNRPEDGTDSALFMQNMTQTDTCFRRGQKMILLAVDMQKGLVDEDLYAFDPFTERTTQLINAARKNRVEVIFVQHDAGPNSGMSVGDEAFEIIDQISPSEGEKVFVKTINSCFGNKDLKQYLKQQTDKRLMIIGLQTNYCIDATVKSAFERGFEVIIPEGTNSTFDNDYMTGETTVRYYNEDVWEELVESVTFEEAIAMLEE